MSKIAHNGYNLVGKKFNRLTVVKRLDNDKCGKRLWECICDCGNIKVLSSSLLINGYTKSCGCLHSDLLKERNKKHSLSKTYIYNTWNGIKARCYNKNNLSYDRYGGRGIKMCDRWLNSFELFVSDIGERPSIKHSIDRIDNNGNYEPSNCRWATAGIQKRNQKCGVLLEYNGIIKNQTDWALFFKVKDSVISGHLKRGRTFSYIYEYLANGKHLKRQKVHIDIYNLKQNEQTKLP